MVPGSSEDKAVVAVGALKGCNSVPTKSKHMNFLKHYQHLHLLHSCAKKPSVPVTPELLPSGLPS